MKTKIITSLLTLSRIIENETRFEFGTSKYYQNTTFDVRQIVNCALDFLSVSLRTGTESSVLSQLLTVAIKIIALITQFKN